MELLLKTLSIISLLFSLQLRARDDDCVPPGTDVRGGEAVQVRAGGDLIEDGDDVDDDRVDVDHDRVDGDHDDSESKFGQEVT